MDGMIWIITNGGVLSFDGERWESISIDNGLVSNSVTSIAVGPDGTIWFGTEYGISRFSRP
jgi:ligand-binding sensor domain-containing protein